MQNKVVIKRSLLGNILLIVGCTIFVAVGALMLRGDIVIRIIGIVSIVFFGFGGLLYLVFMSWKPIAILSDEGITVPYGWRKSFASWENINRIEIVEQKIVSEGGTHKQKYIGVFVNDKTGLVGANARSQRITTAITGWDEVPGLVIVPSFSFEMEKIMEIIQEFYDIHKKGCTATIVGIK